MMIPDHAHRAHKAKQQKAQFSFGEIKSARDTRSTYHDLMQTESKDRSKRNGEAEGIILRANQTHISLGTNPLGASTENQHAFRSPQARPSANMMTRSQINKLNVPHFTISETGNASVKKQDYYAS